MEILGPFFNISVYICLGSVAFYIITFVIAKIVTKIRLKRSEKLERNKSNNNAAVGSCDRAAEQSEPEQ